MVDIDSIVLDNGLEYYIILNLEIDGNTYTLFSNVNDEKDIKIRKIVIENGESYYDGINDEEELKKVITLFDKKLNS